MKIRSVKPQFWSSRTMASVSRDARLLFIGLLNEADDYGRLLGSAKRLAGSLFPYDEDVGPAEVGTWLAILERAGLIQRYDVSGVAHVFVRGFSEHQKMDKRYASRLPAPPALPPTSPQATGGDLVGPADESEGDGGESADGVQTPRSLPSGQPEGSERRKVEGGRWKVEGGKGEGEGEGVSEAPASIEPVDRSRQNPEAPPPPAGVIVARTPGRTGYGGVGFMENPATFPETPEELMERHGVDLRKQFPMFDGKPPRPTLAQAIAAKWGSYIAARSRVGGGHANAFAALTTWLAEMAQKHRVQWEREHTTIVDNSASTRATTNMLKPLQGPHPSEAEDAMPPEEIAKLLAAATSKVAPKSGRVLKRERGT